MKIKKKACDAYESYLSKADWRQYSFTHHKKKEIVVNTRAHNFIQLESP